VNVLVTGGAGYIGSVVCSQLLLAQHNVVVYDNLSRGDRDSVPAGAELVVGDIADRKSLDQLFSSRPFEAVLHFAALIEAGESMRVPEAYFRVNSAVTLTLLEAMLGAGIKKLVFSSTAALYGEPKNVPIRELDKLKPTNVYGESKLLVEWILEWLNRIHGFRYASLRYFNAAGATETLGERHKPRVASNPSSPASGGRTTSLDFDLWNGLSHFRWNLHSRLCSRA
jgi:UDP-glucose 4-epimerase